MTKKGPKKRLVKVPKTFNQQTRWQALEEARALHQSIAKRMIAAGYTYEKIKKDVEHAAKCREFNEKAEQADIFEMLQERKKDPKWHSSDEVFAGLSLFRKDNDV